MLLVGTEKTTETSDGNAVLHAEIWANVLQNKMQSAATLTPPQQRPKNRFKMGKALSRIKYWNNNQPCSAGVQGGFHGFGEMETHNLTLRYAHVDFVPSFITSSTLPLLASPCLVVSSGAKNWISRQELAKIRTGCVEMEFPTAYVVFGKKERVVHFCFEVLLLLLLLLLQQQNVLWWKNILVDDTMILWQEIMARINRLLSFDTTRTAQKIAHPRIPQKIK
jgi:hypothetical protein